jgi:hypothetical protein
VDPVPDPLLLRKSGSVGNRTRTSGSVARNSDHVSQFEYLGTTVSDGKLAQEKIKRRMNSINACYHSDQNLFVYSSPVQKRKNQNIQDYNFASGSALVLNFVPDIEERRLRVFENRV